MNKNSSQHSVDSKQVNIKKLSPVYSLLSTYFIGGRDV